MSFDACGLPSDDAPAAPITVLPAAPERWPDVETMLGRDQERGCWCQYWRLSSSAYAARGPGGPVMRARLDRQPAPGMVAYIGEEVVGWCGIGPRTEMERLSRSRTIPRIDDRPVWSIVCFLVRVGYRRQGVAQALLAGVVAHARQHGAVGLEAYPIDPEGRRVDVAFAYVGTTSMFQRAGFRRVVETASRSAGRPRWLMRLDLGVAAS
jgi:GNAT superfamily N-acetyltransferase